MQCFFLLALTFMGEFPSHAFPSSSPPFAPFSLYVFFMFFYVLGTVCVVVFLSDVLLIYPAV